MNDNKTRGAVSRTPASNRPKGNNYILAIAIDKYEDKNIPELYNSVNDAETIIETLLKK